MNEDRGSRIDGLSSAKRALLLKSLVDAGAPPERRIPRRAGDVPAALSFAQQRLWFMQQYDPDSASLNIHFALRLTGHVDAELLERSLGRLVVRHEVLRTVFEPGEGGPVQVVGGGGFELPLVDVSGEGDPEAVAREWAVREARRPFDLERGPLFRSVLLRLGELEHVLLVTMHHIVSDGWSLGVLVGELSALYGAFALGRPDPLPELPVQYADYAVWQRGHLRGEVAERHLAYWREQLADAPDLLDLPLDRPRPGRHTGVGAQYSFTLPPAVAEALRGVGQGERATPFMVLLSAFMVLLSRYSGQEDVCVGSPVAGRSRAETEGLIGFFVNTLVLRSRVSGRGSFRDVLRDVREVTLGAYEHQELPFERLVEDLRPVRDPSRTPLFQVMFILQNAPVPAVELPGLRLRQLPIDNGTANYDITFELTDRPEGMAAVLEYRTDLFDEATMARLAGHYRVLLEAIVADPDAPLDSLPLLTDEEHERILNGWNRTGTGEPLDRPVHELIARWASLHPERAAAACGDDTVTYGELNGRANRLARTLRDEGVGQETVVALLADRNIDYLVAILAVLKAGGAFLPLDPDQPPTRLGRVIRRSGSPLVLTSPRYEKLLDEALADDGAAGSGPRAARLDLLSERPGAEDDLPVVASPAGLAYVLFTSGSTGAPKGAMLEHAGMLNHIRAKIRDLGMTERDVLAQNGPQSFDVSVWQFLAALTLGGRVEIFGDETAHDPARLLSELDRLGVTVLQAVPSVLRGLIDEARAAGDARPTLSALRWVVPTGDALMPALCADWFALYPDIPLLNTYGSTECSDDQCHHPLHGPDDIDPALPIVSIGRPIGEMRAYVLDGRLSPLPVGVAGELYLGGVGVGRGYLADPARTAEVFVPDPFSSEPGRRLYRTRDRVRLRPDGSIEFLGRTDNLIKVRGFRVEPGEIETALERDPAVRETLVTAFAAAPGDKRLAAYVVPYDTEVVGRDSSTLVRRLRESLRETLPDYMQPSTFTLLEAFPLNANGKVDRSALPVPDGGAEAREYVAPRTEVEHVLVALWAELLGVGQVGVEDSFFDLGGHSLLATRIVARLRRDLKVELPLRAVFESDTVAGLARRVERELAALPGEEADLASLLDQVENLSDSEVERILSAEGPSHS
ncbi:amino acid adenylation domain-containing protein [Streptomyces sp. NBC_01789]|uniref:non-ribosomal peptide synthetase n=3 Tax=Streptomyces TaxID=1883 RepID=UPI0022521FB5|nr:amino acid adenylation domain-containing protein [Streptomyces sp. NBC_01789]MCX4448243.1 amino acid adenylation domain-containing protein [Streptomyces sp. NBC_01789]